jgi:CDP-6-deoxy-D-xylo-4-hexulose-3-dehydrase
MNYEWPLVQSNWTDEANVLSDFILSGKHLTMGANVKEFEKRFAVMHGKKHAIMVNSGSSANLIAVSALVESGRLSRGSYVLVPALGWSTTYFPLIQCQLDPVLIDIHPNTLNIDPVQAENYIQFCI